MQYRQNLAVFRARQGLTKSAMAKKIGVNRGTYADIENGKRPCSSEFLSKLQGAFNVPDSEIWELTKLFKIKSESEGIIS